MCRIPFMNFCLLISCSLLFYFTKTVQAYFSNFWQTYIFHILTIFKQNEGMAKYPPQLGTRPCHLKTLLTNKESLVVTLKWSFKLFNSTLSQFFQTLVITVPGGILEDSYLTCVNTQREMDIMSGFLDHQRMDNQMNPLILVSFSRTTFSLLDRHFTEV